MNEETIVYLGVPFKIGQNENGWWGAYRGFGDPCICAAYESREEVIEDMKEHLDHWGLPTQTDPQ